MIELEGLHTEGSVKETAIDSSKGFMSITPLTQALEHTEFNFFFGDTILFFSSLKAHN